MSDQEEDEAIDDLFDRSEWPPSRYKGMECYKLVRTDDGEVVHIRTFSPRIATVKLLRTKISRHIVVSTIFLGLAHGTHNGQPILYETLSFGMHDAPMTRNTDIEEAFWAHGRHVNEAIKSLNSWRRFWVKLRIAIGGY